MIFTNYSTDRVPNATLQVSLKSVDQFKRRRIFMVYTIHVHVGHLGHVTWTIYINFGSPFLRMILVKLALIVQVVSEKIKL